MLTAILSRAVPDVRVNSATLLKSLVGLYWIQVKPKHYEYWRRFKEAYPHWARVARTYKATGKSMMIDGFCPEFGVLENLFKWLFDVLRLTQSERRLLLLCKEVTVAKV